MDQDINSLSQGPITHEFVTNDPSPSLMWFILIFFTVFFIYLWRKKSVKNQ